MSDRYHSQGSQHGTAGEEDSVRLIQRANASSIGSLRQPINAIRLSQSRNTFSPIRLRSLSPATRLRASTEPAALVLRKRPSIKRTRSDVDEAIHELNTIVRERRLASRAVSALSNNDGHVPAIAPCMKMRVRSETLSDIGSAFSVPITSKPLPAMPEYSEGSYSDIEVDIACQPSLSSRRTTPLPYNALTSDHYVPLTKPQPVYDHTQALSSPSIGTQRPKSAGRRLTAWLRASLTPQPSPSPSSTQPKAPFYQLNTFYTTTPSTPDADLTSSSTLSSSRSLSSSPSARYSSFRSNNEDDNVHGQGIWSERLTSHTALTPSTLLCPETERETETEAGEKLPDLTQGRTSTSKRSFSEHLQQRKRGFSAGTMGTVGTLPVYEVHNSYLSGGVGVGVGMAY
ncbi:hypothetical protein LTS18_006667 [Coniosporium uncinatum]|uniref:Uncharacterized protein n=1 Tax=Coniosporium uncinatum TaxID=93489 RepID=A0ACC3D3D8_9PEZI|nr:hypothetical protein LTS18_006667 [Coniosporium uncinatum]